MLLSQSNSFSEYSGSDNFINLLTESTITPHFQKNLNGQPFKNRSLLVLQLLNYNSFMIILNSNKCPNTSFSLASYFQSCFCLVDMTFHTYTLLSILSDVHNDLLDSKISQALFRANPLQLLHWPYPPSAMSWLSLHCLIVLFTSLSFLPWVPHFHFFP